jgi:hypothetical protein
MNDEQPGGWKRTPGDEIRPVVTSGQASGDTVVGRAHARLVNAGKQFSDYLDQVEAEHANYTPEGLAAQVARFRESDAAKGVATAEQEVAQLVEQAQQRVDGIRTGLSPQGNTADELRAGRYWDRTKAVLDNQSDQGKLAAAAQQAISNADRAELGTLLQELPSYASARGASSAWLDPLLARVVPEYGAAQQHLVKAKQAKLITNDNVRRLREGFRKGHSPHVPLVDPSRYDPERSDH